MFFSQYVGFTNLRFLVGIFCPLPNEAIKGGGKVEKIEGRTIFFFR